MERLRSRRSNVTAMSADRNSRLRLREGNAVVQKQRNLPKLASDSSSCSSDTTEEDLFTWRSSKQVAGIPIKRLLAEEMSKETESKRRPPSVIARLMGLDGLPPQQSSHRQHKRSSENQLHRIVSTGKPPKNGTLSSRGSSRKSSKDEQEFKDVFEVLDASKMESSSYSSQGTVNAKLTEAEMAFIEPKFMEAKRLSTDEKHRDEFRDAVDDLDSNSDLLLKFLEQPDLLFTKHLHDLQGVPPQSHCSLVSATKPSNSLECEHSGIGCRIDRETPCKSRRKCHNKLYSHSNSRHTADNPMESSKIQLEGKDLSNVLPTRIVVLKPNLGKLKNASGTVQSPVSSHNFLAESWHSEHMAVEKRESELCERKKCSDDVEPSRCKSREIAKEITKKVRRSFSHGSVNFSASGFRGYAGDESSSNRSENDSANESETTTITSRNSIDWSNRRMHSSPRLAESSVIREARKRLSERWKLTHKSVDMGVISRGSTLGEMLAIPDREVRPPSSNTIVHEKGVRDKVDGNDEPLGISSRDGWKDGCFRNLPRSRSVPASSTVVSSPKTGMGREVSCNSRHMMPNASMQWERNRVLKGNSSKGDGSASRYAKSCVKKSHVTRCAYNDFSDASPEIHLSHNQAQSSIPKGNPFEQSHLINETTTDSVSENVLDVPHEAMAVQDKPTDPDMLVKGNSSISNLEVLDSQESSNSQAKKDSTLVQHPFTELASPASSKEAEQPSPVSVLETPFPDDLSSGSECFESLSADLHGLRMQLQLLKLESEAYEGPMLVSSDEDVEEGAVSEERGPCEESRELSYIVDLLGASGINEDDPDTFIATWHSPECPVNPLVFEELEKKYCNHSSWPRSERKLLFDQINTALLVTYQQFVNPHPWLRPAARIAPKWIKHGFENHLLKLLASQDKKANKVAAGNVLAKESEWLELRDDVDMIGREIERLLVEELANELVIM